MKSTLKPRLLCLFVFVVLSSCTTQFKKAQNLIEEKNYDEALVILEKLVADDPQDADYKVGLKKAREGVIDQSLIRVRLTRLGSNPAESLELLRSVFEQQNTWGLFPTGAVAFTQSEEVSEAFITLKNEILSLKKSKKPLRVMYLSRRYNILFSEKQNQYFQEQYVAAANDAKKFCLEHASLATSETYFYNQLIAKWCKLTEQKATIPPSKPHLFKLAHFKNAQTQNTAADTFQKIFEQKFNELFQKSEWALAASEQNLIFNYTGNFDLLQSQAYEFKQHSYIYKSPYTQSTTQSVTDPATGKTQTQTINETKYREETKYFPYQAYVEKQTVHARVQLSSLQPLSISTVEESFSDSAQKESHSFMVPAVSLYPSTTGKIYTQLEWLDKSSQAISMALMNKLEFFFHSNYCDSLQDTQKKASFFDQALICLRQKTLNKKPKASLEIIQRKFNETFQMTPVEMETLMKVVE